MGGHILEDVGHLLPQRDEGLIDGARLAGPPVITVTFLDLDGPDSAGQALLPVRLQRIDEDLLLAGAALVIRRQTPTSLSVTQKLPIGRPITRVMF
jgi:hypothetical protein